MDIGEHSSKIDHNIIFAVWQWHGYFFLHRRRALFFTCPVAYCTGFARWGNHTPVASPCIALVCITKRDRACYQCGCQINLAVYFQQFLCKRKSSMKDRQFCRAVILRVVDESHANGRRFFVPVWRFWNDRFVYGVVDIYKPPGWDFDIFRELLIKSRIVALVANSSVFFFCQLLQYNSPLWSIHRKALHFPLCVILHF